MRIERQSLKKLRELGEVDSGVITSRTIPTLFGRILQESEADAIVSATDHSSLDCEAAAHAGLVGAFERNREGSAGNPAILSDHVEAGDADVADLVFL